MSKYGKINLIGMLGLPLVAVVGSIIIFGLLIETQLFVLWTNAVPMLIGGLVSGLLLRSARKSGSRGSYIALLPTLVPATFGVLWYLLGVVAPGADSGREYFAGPFYLLVWAIGTAVFAWIGSMLVRIRN